MISFYITYFIIVVCNINAKGVGILGYRIWTNQRNARNVKIGVGMMENDNYSLDTIPKEIFNRLNPIVKAYLIWEKEISENNQNKDNSD